MGRQQGQEYFIAVKLTTIWNLMITHVRDTVRIPTRGDVRKQNRIQTMLSYLHENYMRDLTLEEIAGAANISVGECCRCFRQMIGTSPNRYLLRYQITMAMELLATTEMLRLLYF